MRWGVVTFPGSNDDRETRRVLSEILGDQVVQLWHKDGSIADVDCVVLPGGFSYGDYLRCGAVARFSPIMKAVRAHAAAGGAVLGICNGFQVLCEAGLLPGALVTNESVRFVCRDVVLRVDNVRSMATLACRQGELLTVPIKHGAGCYVADDATVDRLEQEGRVLLRYVTPTGDKAQGANPNGSRNDIAAVANDAGNVVGMMPHPEYAVDPLLGGTDGVRVFQSVRAWQGARDTKAAR